MVFMQQGREPSYSDLDLIHESIDEDEQTTHAIECFQDEDEDLCLDYE